MKAYKDTLERGDGLGRYKTGEEAACKKDAVKSLTIGCRNPGCASGANYKGYTSPSHSSEGSWNKNLQILLSHLWYLNYCRYGEENKWEDQQYDKSSYLHIDSSLEDCAKSKKINSNRFMDIKLPLLCLCILWDIQNKIKQIKCIESHAQIPYFFSVVNHIRRNGINNIHYSLQPDASFFTVCIVIIPASK